MAAAATRLCLSPNKVFWVQTYSRNRPNSGIAQDLIKPGTKGRMPGDRAVTGFGCQRGAEILQGFSSPCFSAASR